MSTDHPITTSFPTPNIISSEKSHPNSELAAIALFCGIGLLASLVTMLSGVPAVFY